MVARKHLTFTFVSFFCEEYGFFFEERTYRDKADAIQTEETFKWLGQLVKYGLPPDEVV